MATLREQLRSPHSAQRSGETPSSRTTHAMLSLESVLGQGTMRTLTTAVLFTLLSILFTACGEDDAHASLSTKVRHTVDLGDLDRIKERGRLRIAVLPRTPIPLLRSAAPATRDRDLASHLAQSLGLTPEFIPVATRDELIEHIEKGHADLAAGNLTITASRSRRVAFTKPTRSVNEVLVGPANDTSQPKTIADLAGRKIFVWGRSSYAETLSELSQTKAKGLLIVPTSPELDDESLLYLTSAGRVPLTVVDSDVLANFQTFDPSVVERLTLREGRKIAWVVRKGNPKLLRAANAYITKHAGVPLAAAATGDLDAIRKRGSLRVLTRNNSVSYFLYRGKPVGFDYELAQQIAKKLGVRLEMIVPPTAEDLIPWLNEGRGDVIAASFTITPARNQIVSFTKPYLYSDEIIVAKKGSAPIPDLATLKSKAIHLRPSSSYRETMRRLIERAGPFAIRDAAEDLETEELIDLVGRGKIPLTIADSHVLAVENCYRDDVIPALRITSAPEGSLDTIGKPRTKAKSIAYAVRKSNPKLLAWIDAHVQKSYRGLHYNVTHKRYFENRKKKPSKHKRLNDASRISKYDDLFKHYATRYELDWRLIAAQAWQESRFDPKAKSWVGAQGLMQVMPATGKEMGFTDLHDPDVSCHAGVKYLAKQIAAFDPKIPLEIRTHFGLASYNGGRGHVLDAMRLAKQRGWAPHKWFGNVEKAILLLQDREIAKTARYGYCRGSEVHSYVRKIMARYQDYAQLVPK